MKKTAIRMFVLLLTLTLLASMTPVLTASAATLEEKQRAAVATAWAYYDKGFPVQYDSVDLSVVSKGNGGAIRSTHEVPPEYATPDETMYSVCSDYAYQIYYNAFGYKLCGDPVKCWTGKLSKYVPGKDPICVYVYDSHKDDTPREQAIKEYCKHLEPGDVINGVSAVGKGGHVMVYIGDALGDGTKYLLHCSGYKYRTKTGADQPECRGDFIKEIPDQIIPHANDTRNNNAISLCPCEEYLQKRYNAKDKKNVVLSVIRPLNVIKDEENPLTPSVLARLQFPRLSIDRTATKMRFRDVEEGGALTLSVKLTNFSKQAYTVPVKETVPEGVTFVKASDGGKVSGKDISWEVRLNAGESKTVSYDCTVTAKRGETVVFTGGSVSTIPSNTIRIPVGGKQLTDAEKALLTEVAKGGHAELFKDVSKDKIPSLVWNKLLKLNVPLPTPNVMMRDVLKKTTFAKKTVYDLRDDLQGDAAIFRKMIVPEFYGGFYCAEMDTLKRVLDLKCDYLQPGDIVFEIEDLDVPGRGQTLVYLGDGQFLTQAYTVGGAKIGTFFELQKAHTFKLFYALRPTLAYDDVHGLPELPAEVSVSKFTDVKSGDWFYTYVKTLVEDGTVNGMTATTFVPNGTLTYGQALKLIALSVGEKEPAKSGAHWASGWLTLAKSKGWLKEDVNPDAAITRLALCKIAAKAKGLTGQPSVNPFKDTSDKDVLALNKAKVINGMTATEFKPNELLTRAQISKIIVALREAASPQSQSGVPQSSGEETD